MKSITAILTGQERRSSSLTLLKDDTTGLIYQLTTDNGLMYYTQVETIEYYYDKPIMIDKVQATTFCLGVDGGSLYIMEV